MSLTRAPPRSAKLEPVSVGPRTGDCVRRVAEPSRSGVAWGGWSASEPPSFSGLSTGLGWHRGSNSPHNPKVAGSNPARAANGRLSRIPYEKHLSVSKPVSARPRQICGPRPVVRIPAYRLREKIFEVDQLAPSDSRIIEIHPEVSFRHLAGTALPASKHTWVGFWTRLDLLRRVGIDVPIELGVAGSAGLDDVLDGGSGA